MYYQCIKCSTQNNDNKIANKYCNECNLYMCNNCLNSHQNLFKYHQILDLIDDKAHLVNEFCKEDKHSNKLEYYCETHNQLCCLSCIGNHKNCKMYGLYDIINDKKES